MRKILNGLCVALAFLCIAIGGIGIVLPVLPTTPFFLLALMLFAKGSKRFHKWFMGTLLYKKYLETYVNTKSMPTHTKRNVLFMVSILFTFGFIFSPVLWARIIIVIVWVGHFYFFLFRIKTTEKNESDEKPKQELTAQEKESNKKKKAGFWKKFLSSFFVVGILVFMLCGGWSNENMKSKPEAKAEAILEDGIYSIPISLWHATNNAASMGNGALDQSGKLVIKDGAATLYMHLVSFSYYGLTGSLMELDLLQDISYNQSNYPMEYNLLNGTVISTYATVDEYNAADSTDVICAGKLYPKVVSIPITVNTEYMWAHVYVPVMGSLGFGDQLCRIKVDYSNLSEMSEEQIQLWNGYEISDTADNTDDGTNDNTDDGTDDNTDDGTDDSIDDGGNTVAVDKSALKTKLDTANTLVAQTDVYTEATISNLKSAITTAQKAYDSTSVTQIVVNAQVTALQGAIDALVKKSSEILDKDNLKDGKYNVYIALWHATSDQASMGDAAMNHTALITVKNGVYTLDFSTHPMRVGTITACLQSIQIEQPNGTYVNAAITAKDNTLDDVAMPSVFSFTMPSKEEYINVKIDPKVEVMGTDPLPARLKIGWDTLTSIADDATVEQDTETVTTGDVSPAVDLTDSTTKVRIKADANILAEGVGMTVTEILSGTDYLTVQELLADIGTEFTAYDITLYNSSGTQIEPSGMVTVYIPIPEDYDSDTIAVYRIKDSAKTKLTTSVKDGYAVFQTNSFSIFALVDTSSITKSTLPTTKTGGTLPKQSTSSSVSAKNSSSVGANSSIQQSTDQDIADEQALANSVTGQIQQLGSTIQMNQLLTVVLLGTTIIGSMLIMLFVIGFILADNLLRRRK